MFLRRLRDVREKTTFLRYGRDVLKTSHKTFERSVEISQRHLMSTGMCVVFKSDLQRVAVRLTIRDAVIIWNLKIKNKLKINKILCHSGLFLKT